MSEFVKIKSILVLMITPSLRENLVGVPICCLSPRDCVVKTSSLQLTAFLSIKLILKSPIKNISVLSFKLALSNNHAR